MSQVCAKSSRSWSDDIDAGAHFPFNLSHIDTASVLSTLIFVKAAEYYVKYDHLVSFESN